ncbi:MAG: SRPBCC family protein [Candidatus Eisenbacteria bacterium]|nr:SRPBCC family protein [Candidatus Eisenbacteria bacterium]
MRVLRREQRFRRPLDEVFAFFADAHNLKEITPPFLGFRILTPAPIQMRVGARIDYRIRLHGIPIRWETEITAWDPPHHFVDEQRRGPYHVWHHEHRFREESGEVVVTDEVTYSHLGGPLVHALLIAPDLRRIFDYRADRLRARFSS